MWKVQVERVHGITAMCWSPDGSYVALGTISGCTMLYSAYFSRSSYKEDFDIMYSSLDKANIRHRSTGVQPLELCADLQALRPHASVCNNKQAADTMQICSEARTIERRLCPS